MMKPAAAFVSLADVQTAHASRYMQQLAKHWGHKFETRLTAEDAEIALPMGLCRLHAEADRLRVRLEGDADADMPRFQAVVADHLARFGHRETLSFDWRATQGG